MARGRMVNKSISASQKFNTLPDDTCRLLATWIIPNLDKNGVFHGEAALVRSAIFPLREDVTNAQIEQYLQAIEQVTDDEGGRLMIRFKVRGRLWQYWPGFDENQPGLRKERERTEYPMPPTLAAAPPAPAEVPPIPAEVPPPPVPDTAGQLPDNRRATDRQSLDESNTTGNSTLSQGKTLTFAADGAPFGAAPAPLAFADWLIRLQPKEANKVAILREMHETLFPGRDPPDYGYIGKTVRAVSGAGRLAELLWQASTRPPTGDILAYCLKTHENEKQRSSGRNRYSQNLRDDGDETKRAEIYREQARKLVDYYAPEGGVA